MLSANAIHTACTKNRAEEFGFDVWEHFIIPFFFDRLDLADTQKPTLVIGGRGCGKTMLLRYLLHDTTFSTKNPLVHKAAFARIGLYWKADTQFASALTGRGIPQDVWEMRVSPQIGVGCDWRTTPKPVQGRSGTMRVFYRGGTASHSFRRTRWLRHRVRRNR